MLLPVPVVLAGVLVKASDHLAKSRAQVAYRLATSRQQLLVDTRPTLDNLKIFAEFLHFWRRKSCRWEREPELVRERAVIEGSGMQPNLLRELPLYITDESFGGGTTGEWRR